MNGFAKVFFLAAVTIVWVALALALVRAFAPYLFCVDPRCPAPSAIEDLNPHNVIQN